VLEKIKESKNVNRAKPSIMTAAKPLLIDTQPSHLYYIVFKEEFLKEKIVSLL